MTYHRERSRTLLPGVGWAPSAPQNYDRYDFQNEFPWANTSTEFKQEDEKKLKIEDTPCHRSSYAISVPRSSRVCSRHTSLSCRSYTEVRELEIDEIIENIGQAGVDQNVFSSRREEPLADKYGSKRQIVANNRKRLSHSSLRDRSRSPARRSNSTQDRRRDEGGLYVAESGSESRYNEEEIVKSSDSSSCHIKSEPPGTPEPGNAASRPGCLCPINLQCPAREDNHIDCRTLTLERDWNLQRATILEVTELVKEGLDPNDFAQLQNVLKICKICSDLLNGPVDPRRRKRIFESIETWMREMCCHNISEAVMEQAKQAGVLEKMRHFLSGEWQPLRARVRFPIQLEEDLTILYRKWNKGDLEINPHRGLQRVQELQERRGRTVAVLKYHLDKSWPHYTNAATYGHNGLVNGQRWDNRIQMMRDGAHCSREAGICGNIKQGAYAVVMGHHQTDGCYADVDEENGRIVYYIGTALSREEGTHEPTNAKDVGVEIPLADPTRCTQMLMASLRTKNPVRMIRSSNQTPICRRRPDESLGRYRYDGLYEVVDYECLKRRRQIYRFKMVRLNGQGPIRER